MFKANTILLLQLNQSSCRSQVTGMHLSMEKDKLKADASQALEISGKITYKAMSALEIQIYKKLRNGLQLQVCCNNNLSSQRD